MTIKTASGLTKTVSVSQASDAAFKVTLNSFSIRNDSTRNIVPGNFFIYAIGGAGSPRDEQLIYSFTRSSTFNSGETWTIPSETSSYPNTTDFPAGFYIETIRIEAQSQTNVHKNFNLTMDGKLVEVSLSNNATFGMAELNPSLSWTYYSDHSISISGTFSN